MAKTVCVTSLRNALKKNISEGVKERKTRRTTSTQRGKTVFDRLVAAGKRLMTVITHNEGGTNKDLAKFTDQINALCDKWDR